MAAAVSGLGDTRVRPRLQSNQLGMTVMGLAQLLTRAHFLWQRRTSPSRALRHFKFRFFCVVQLLTPPQASHRRHNPPLLSGPGTLLDPAVWVYTSALAFAVTLIALYQLFIDSIMKQGVGRKPCGTTSPWLRPAPRSRHSSRRARSGAAWGMLLGTAFTMTPWKIFSCFASSALHFWLNFRHLSPMLCIRCCLL